MDKYIMLTAYETSTPTTHCYAESAYVSSEYLCRWILCSHHTSVDQLLSSCTGDEFKDIVNGSARAGYLAFVRRPGTGRSVEFPEFCRGDAILAVCSFLSAGLRDFGYVEAAQHIESLLEG